MADVLTGIVSGFNISGKIAGLSTMAIWIIGTLLIGLLLFIVIYWFMMFPIKVTILKKRAGGGIQYFIDYVKPVRDKITRDIVAYQFRSMPFTAKKELAPPSSDAMFIDKRGKPMFFITENEAGNYEPIQWELARAMMVSEDRDTKVWHASRHRENLTKWAEGSFLSKYANVISWGIIIVLMFVFGLILFQKLETVAEMLGQVATAMKSTAVMCGNVGV